MVTRVYLSRVQPAVALWAQTVAGMQKRKRLLIISNRSKDSKNRGGRILAGNDTKKIANKTINLPLTMLIITLSANRVKGKEFIRLFCRKTE